MNAQYNFLAPLLMGIKEAFNPYALATVLLSLIFLYRIGKSRREILLIGSFFILSVLATTLVLSFGILDFLFKSYFFAILARIFYLALAVIFLLAGNSLLREWRQYRFPKNQKDGRLLVWPPFLEKEEASSKKRMGALIISAGVLAFFATFFSAVWPQNYYMFLMFYYWVSQADTLLSVLSFIGYGIGFVLPLLVVWLSVWMFISSRRLNNFLVKAGSYVKIIISSIYFSVAISLIYLSIK